MNPQYSKTHFLHSTLKFQDIPDTGWEVAFAGRSNAGKSSAINAITNQRALARISKTPGRTQTLVFFQVDETRRLVDLPGYGFAQAPGPLQQRWRTTLEGYFRQRRCLAGVFLIMDIRHPLTVMDLHMINWCKHYRRPVHVLLTKADKLNYGSAQNTLLKVQQMLEPYALTCQLFSATKKTGIEQAHAMLDRWLEV
ncbi:MAG: ribosome biogenesis GTP-binding protein YihA/YsxC [Methylohalobius sp.]|nr:ribosome biogenesis GTP-binding protein YihA/YsxC [Methylohalobius sp.]